MYLDRVKVIKNLILNSIVKGILLSNCISNKYKLQSNFKRKKLNLKNTRLKAVCFISGKERAVNKHIGVNRNALNRLLILNKVNNYKVNSW